MCIYNIYTYAYEGNNCLLRCLPKIKRDLCVHAKSNIEFVPQLSDIYSTEANTIVTNL